MENSAGLMAKMELFADCAPGILERLKASAFLQSRTRGSVLFEQGEPAEFLHVVISGSVALEGRGENGTSTILEIMGPGEIFRLPAVVLDQPNATGAWLMAESTILLIPAAEFRAALAQDAALARRALALLARQFKSVADQVLDLKLRDAPRRVARFLAQRLEPEQAGGFVELPEPRGALAARLGMRPESLSRALHALQEAGLVKLTGRRVEVRDRKGLMRLQAA
ncbi:cyclic nucleotide-binding domain-containing protein [Acetobacteraceae bacterium H6797]|nr:cyclic nucleotide-binding domain-containing protein [Acetobacteraceae bacterium H6797]